jgi:hypothetical protein
MDAQSMLFIQNLLFVEVRGTLSIVRLKVALGKRILLYDINPPVVSKKGISEPVNM